jgi:Domain of unknown function (DUF4333)
VRLALTAAVALALLVAACGEKTVDASAAEETVTGLIADETGFEADDMSCPDDVPAEVDEEFECEFTGPEGPYVASVTITEVDGDDAVFQVESRRAD